MWKKLQEFFKKAWWVVLVPIGLFVLSLVFKDNENLRKLIKEKQKEIRKDEKNVKTSEEEKKKSEENLDEATEKVKDTMDAISGNKEERDEQAKKFFPNL